MSLPSPSCRLNCAAEIPFECVVARWMAATHFFSGTCVRCRNVPAVAEVCFRRSWYRCAQRGRLSRTALRLPQSGHRNRTRQRIFAKYSAHASSSRNRLSSCARVIVGIGLLRIAMPQGLAESRRPINSRTQHLVVATRLRIQMYEPLQRIEGFLPNTILVPVVQKAGLPARHLRSGRRPRTGR